MTCKFNGRERTFSCHSLVMELMSGYFEILLATEMRESIEKKVTLDDVDPDIFELGMSLLEDPAKAIEASVEDALKVASFYDRFQFKSGMKAVEAILGKFLDKWVEKGCKENPTCKEFELIVQTIVFADKGNIEWLGEKAANFVKKKTAVEDVLGIGLFTEESIERLHHFLVKHPDCVEHLLGDDWKSFGNVPDIKDPSFPSKFHHRLCRYINLDSMRSSGITISVCFSFTDEYGNRTDERIAFEVLDLPRNTIRFRIKDEGTTSESFLDAELFPFNKKVDGDGYGHGVLNTFQDLDWFMYVELRDTYIEFVSPFSKSLTLPPTPGKAWKQLPRAEPPDEKLEITGLKILLG